MRFETIERVLHCRNSCGRPFQTCGSATEKLRSLTEVTVWGTVNMSMQEERRERIGLCGYNILFKYGGVPSFTALKQSEAVLNSFRLRTGNQWKKCRSELGAWRLALQTIRTALFIPYLFIGWKTPTLSSHGIWLTFAFFDKINVDLRCFLLKKVIDNI